MDGERYSENGGGETSMEEENGVNKLEEIDLVGETVKLIEYVARLEDYRRTQRKECYNLVRRMKILLPFLDEIRHLGSPIPDNVIVCLSKLKKALCLAKKLLKSCNDGSKIYMVRMFLLYMILVIFFFFLKENF